MSPFFLLLIVLIGLLGPSMSLDPRRPALDDTDIIVPGNGEHAFGHGYLQHESIPRATHGDLLDYQMMCTEDPNVDPPQGYKAGALLSDKFCGLWFECNPDGTMEQKREYAPWWTNEPKTDGGPTPKTNVEWCNSNCECDLADKPTDHFTYLMGCPGPNGSHVGGSYDSIARDTVRSLSKGGLIMETFDGPLRQE